MAAHLLLESSGLAMTLVSEIESQQSKVNADTVQFSSASNVNVTGYLCLPQSSGKFPAVVVIHENRGLNDHARGVARRFAAESYVVLASYLLSRKGGTAAMQTPEKTREAIGTVTAEEAITDLKMGLAFLDKHAKVKTGQLALVGFCWGGARSFLLAAESEQLPDLTTGTQRIKDSLCVSVVN